MYISNLEMLALYMIAFYRSFSLLAIQPCDTNPVNSQYRRTAHFNVTHRRRQNFYALPTAQWQMLAAPPFNILANLDRVDDAIDVNADLALQILDAGLQLFGVEAVAKVPALRWHNAATARDMDKIRTTIRQLYRDWSAEGTEERRACYEPVLNDVAQAFSRIPANSSVEILVPGAGLGRLVYELCKGGYTVEGNEFSYHQLIASSWVLNHTKRAEEFDLYPFVLEFSNIINREHQLKAVKVPDVHPGTDLVESVEQTNNHPFDRMRMTAGDFVILYSDEQHHQVFDAVVTVYFIDTAPNLIKYIQTVHNCLKEGGVWINIGPLLWHFGEREPLRSDEEDSKSGRRWSVGIEEPGSVEFTDDEILLLIQSSGFDIEKHEILKSGSGYIQNPESMLQNIYRTSHWIARKKS